jgi:hypothetical protein
VPPVVSSPETGAVAPRADPAALLPTGLCGTGRRFLETPRTLFTFGRFDCFAFDLCAFDLLFFDFFAFDFFAFDFFTFFAIGQPQINAQNSETSPAIV